MTKYAVAERGVLLQKNHETLEIWKLSFKKTNLSTLE